MQQTATADGEAVKDPELMRHVKSTVPEAVHDVQAIDIGRVPPVTKLSALEKLAAEEVSVSGDESLDRELTRAQVADSLRLARGEMKGCTSHPLPASTATQVSQQLESLLRKAHAELDAIQRDLAASSVRNSPQERVTLQQEQQHVRRTLGEIETARSEEQMELHTRGGISRGLVNMIAALEAEVAVEDAELVRMPPSSCRPY